MSSWIDTINTELDYANRRMLDAESRLVMAMEEVSAFVVAYGRAKTLDDLKGAYVRLAQAHAGNFCPPLPSTPEEQ